MPRYVRKELRAPGIRKLPVPSAWERPGDAGGARDYPDSLVHGLVVNVKPSGVRSWCLRYRFDGLQRRYTIGRFPDIGVEAARKIAKDLRVRIASGEDVQVVKVENRRKAKVDTFHDLALRFVGHQRTRIRSWRDQASTLGLVVKKTPAGKLPDLSNPKEPIRWEVEPGSVAAKWGRRNVGTIEKREVAELLKTVSDQRGPSAATKLQANLSKLFGWLVREGVLQTDPTDNLNPGHQSESRERALEDWELRLVWQAAEALGGPVEAFTKLLFLTAARRSEVSAIAKSEVQGNVWTIPGARTKNKRDHVLPLPLAALEVLAITAPNKAGFYLNTDSKTHIQGYAKLKTKLDEKVAEISKGKTVVHWTWHDARRTVSTGCAKIGIQPHIIDELINHKTGTADRKLHKTYVVHPYFNEKADALERWALHLGHIIDGEKCTCIPKRS